ncbi:MAG TPA: AI-2E family transporter [Fimbriimonadaceae bacterium]|nr:AI-2E family transporter [Fimbriimonadaceae bacterium]HRJ33362.1 AI-2E family transporter [Fimbriimonadaceae bacterium]
MVKGWKIGIWVIVVLVALWFLQAVRSILLPFVLALLISVLLDPVIRKLRLRGYKRGSAVALVFFAFFGLLTALGIWVTPIIGKQLSSFQENLQGFTARLSAEDPSENLYLGWNPVLRAQPHGAEGQVDLVLESLAPYLQRVGLPSDRETIVEQYVEPHREDFSNLVTNFFTSFLGILGKAASSFLLLLFTPLFVWLMLMDLEKFRVKSASWIPPSIRAETVSLLKDIGEVFLKYLRGVTITIFTYTLLMAVVLSVMGTPYSILLALLAGATYLIPFVGQWIATLAILLVVGLNGASGNWMFDAGGPWNLAVIIALVFIGIGTIFDQVIYPKMVGSAVGLHPLVSMFVIFAGGALFGLIGMILAFPLAGAVKVILERVLRITSSSHVEGLELPITPLRHRSATEV